VIPRASVVIHPLSVSVRVEAVSVEVACSVSVMTCAQQHTQQVIQSPLLRPQPGTCASHHEKRLGGRLHVGIRTAFQMSSPRSAEGVGLARDFGCAVRI